MCDFFVASNLTAVAVNRVNNHLECTKRVQEVINFTTSECGKKCGEFPPAFSCAFKRSKSL